MEYHEPMRDRSESMRDRRSQPRTITPLSGAAVVVEGPVRVPLKQEQLRTLG